MEESLWYVIEGGRLEMEVEGIFKHRRAEVTLGGHLPTGLQITLSLRGLGQ